MKLKLLIITCLSLCISRINSQNSTILPKKLDSLFLNLHSNQSFNGNVLIAKGDQIIYTGNFGLANFEANVPLNDSSIFELASVSKQFTAFAIFQLIQENKISLIDPVYKYIPELKHYKNITIKHLIEHSSGIPDYMEFADNLIPSGKIYNNIQILKLFKSRTPALQFKPGSKFEYSNTGYLVLGTIIERVSNMSYEEYLNKVIFEPIGMRNTLVYRRRFAPKNVPNSTLGYYYHHDLQQKVTPDYFGSDFYVVKLDGVVGDGMVNSTTLDLFKWSRYLTQHPELSSKLFSEFQLENEQSTNYGYGWFISQNKKFGKKAYHTGSWAGYLTSIEKYLDEDWTVIMLQNMNLENSKLPTKSIQKILFNLPIENRIELDTTIQKKYVGVYKSENRKDIEVYFNNGRLYVPFNNNIELDLIPVRENKFIVEGFSPEVTYTFNITNNNKIQLLIEQIEMDIEIWAEKE